MLLVVCLTLSLLAHDMWIEPATFSPVNGQLVGVRLKVGQDMMGDPLPRSSGLINRFVFEDGSGPRPLVGREGGDPAGFLRVSNTGMIVVGYNSNPSKVDLTAEKFNSYLKEEGLDSVAALRASRKQTTANTREQFSRCAKSLLLSGTPAAGSGDRVLGFPLELLAERNPYTMTATEDLPVRLTYENKPLAGALIVAMNRLNPTKKISVRTGKDGRVRLRLPRKGGMWLVKAVHMIPAAAGSDAEWSSFWASLTFEVPAAPAR